DRLVEDPRGLPGPGDDLAMCFLRPMCHIQAEDIDACSGEFEDSFWVGRSRSDRCDYLGTHLLPGVVVLDRALWRRHPPPCQKGNVGYPMRPTPTMQTEGE